MSNHDIIHNTPEPRTRESIAADLRHLGVTAGMTLLVHSSLSSLGWVSGGPVAVVLALMDVLTPDGTLVMPSHTSANSDPAKWENPPVPEAWWQIIYDTMPPFDPQMTPTNGMGIIAETFRKWYGVLRSNHPTDSFATWGRNAAFITENHSLAYGLGEQSPLARVYDLDGYVLLLGVGYDRNTSFHLAEYRAPNAVQTELGAPIIENGERICKHYADNKIDSDIFPEIGADMERETKIAKIGKVGSATVRYFPQRLAVDYAEQWLTKRRAS
jgi:aminoglycoside 3-N-acetyltransferase